MNSGKCAGMSRTMLAQPRAALKSRIQKNLGKGHKVDPCSSFSLPAVIPRDEG